ncbi:hypothetical protein [Planococcus sp. CAU13]|uniref:hypothetical protein n=1 Tax=Planococcus sp. CAU13 TaxID=1541197 RepID=UPI00068B5A74|nr:hypothetical protein [Planococcus sp. CAU13]
MKSNDSFTEVEIIGYSEGSLIGVVAAERASADSFISIAGAGRHIDEVLMEQLAAQLPENLMNEARQIIFQLKEGEPLATVSPELQSVFCPWVQPYMISWLAFNPQEEVATQQIRRCRHPMGKACMRRIQNWNCCFFVEFFNTYSKKETFLNELDNRL